MTARIDALWLYPIKGCRGFSVPSARLAQTGLEVDGIGDREWVVVDDQGEFFSQRELPKMALIETRLTGVSLRLKAPGMLQLDVPFRIGRRRDQGARVERRSRRGDAGRHCRRVVLAISWTALPTDAIRPRGQAHFQLTNTPAH